METYATLQTLIAVVITLGSIGSIFLFMWIWWNWFPRTTHFRIKTKTKGAYTYNRAEVYRPILGWTGFWISKYCGSIMYDSSWNLDRSSCIENIEVYKSLKSAKLKPLEKLEKELYPTKDGPEMG
jgi:hypothetical protein